MCHPRIFDHDLALKLWERGLPRGAIGKRLNTKPHTVYGMVRLARLRGDVRAVRRYLINGVKKYPYRITS